MSFRSLPKRRLVLMVPEAIYDRLMEVKNGDKTERSRSDHGSEALAKGLGMKPTWTAKRKGLRASV